MGDDTMKGYFRKRGTKWSFTIDVGRDPKTGKRKQKTKSGFNTKRDAQKACAELITQIENGQYVEISKDSISEFLIQWLENHAKQVLRPSTYDVHKWTIESQIIPAIGMLTLNKVTALDIQNFYNEKIKEGLSASYVRRMHSILHSSFEKAVKWGLIQKNIINAVDPPRKELKEIQTWDIQTVRLFLSKIKGEYLRIVYVLALYTGMRKGEILGLRWKDIDFENKKISIRQTLYRTREGIIFQEPKTKTSRRMISVPDYVIDELKSHRIQQNKWKLQLGEAFVDKNLVVTNPMGNPMDPRGVKRNMDKLMKEIDVPIIRFHDMRHTHATIMLQLGEHPKVVSERLGHSKVPVTLDIYSHVTPDMQKESADKFAIAIEGK